MSLTGFLKDPKSSIGKLFRESFEPSNFLKEIWNNLKSTECIRSSNFNIDRASLIGTAIDYRIRYYFDIPHFYDLVAYHGIYKGHEYIFNDLGLWGKGKEYDFLEGAIMYFTVLNSFLRSHKIVRQKLNKTIESELNRHCLTLAMLERLFRNPEGVISRWVNAPDSIEFYFKFYDIPVIGLEKGTSRILWYWRKDLVDEMNILSYLFYEKCKSLLRYRNFWLNPTFELSYAVGGADADLIVNKTLIEIKSTIKNIRSMDLYQLLGYVLLNKPKQYEIQYAGIYFVRRGVLLKWKVIEFFHNLAPRIDYNKFKRKFYKIIDGHKSLLKFFL